LAAFWRVPTFIQVRDTTLLLSGPRVFCTRPVSTPGSSPEGMLMLRSGKTIFSRADARREKKKKKTAALDVCRCTIGIPRDAGKKEKKKWPGRPGNISRGSRFLKKLFANDPVRSRLRGGKKNRGGVVLGQGCTVAHRWGGHLWASAPFDLLIRRGSWLLCGG